MSKRVSDVQTLSVLYHYNKKKIRRTSNEREESILVQLRKANNAVKKQLILRYGVQNGRTLDAGCGDGGDLNKWNRLFSTKVKGIQYYAFDPSSASIDYFKKRLETVAPLNRCSQVYTGDMSNSESWTLFPNESLDCVSTQFCFHYVWDDIRKIQSTLLYLSRAMKPGAYWIGTLLDMPRMYALLSESESTDHQRTATSSAYSFSMKESAFQELKKQHEKAQFKSKDVPTASTYVPMPLTVSITDSIDQCTEWIVHWPLFVKLCWEHGLELVESKCFSEYSTIQQQFLSKDEKTLFKIYRTFVWKKKKTTVY